MPNDLKRWLTPDELPMPELVQFLTRGDAPPQDDATAPAHAERIVVMLSVLPSC